MSENNENIDLADVLGEAESEPVVVGGVSYPIYALRLRDFGTIQRITGEADFSLGTIDGMLAVAFCNMRRTNPSLTIDGAEALFNINDGVSLVAMTTMFTRVVNASGLIAPAQGAGTAKKEPGAEPAARKASKSTVSES